MLPSVQVPFLPPPRILSSSDRGRRSSSSKDFTKYRTAFSISSKVASGLQSRTGRGNALRGSSVHRGAWKATSGGTSGYRGEKRRKNVCLRPSSQGGTSSRGTAAVHVHISGGEAGLATKPKGWCARHFWRASCNSRRARSGFSGERPEGRSFENEGRAVPSRPSVSLLPPSSAKISSSPRPPPGSAPVDQKSGARAPRGLGGSGKMVWTSRRIPSRGAETNSFQTASSWSSGPVRRAASLARASPVLWSPRTTHRSRASASRTFSTARSILEEMHRDRKKRRWAAQNSRVTWWGSLRRHSRLRWAAARSLSVGSSSSSESA
mmetsp:Transcript_5725/g.12083  ORF Transcript_5725/g.12083 Transcript_5725/m.12083 type:complete len:322 (-) Transcript_5725:341-1306(-)